MSELFVVVSYDIPDDRRRSRMARLLLDFGTRIQFSVFECVLDEGDAQKMVKRIKKVVAPEDDSIRIYRLCKQCRRAIEIIGRGEPTTDPDVYVV